MGTTPYPLPRAYRESDILDCDGVSLTYGPFNFKIFDLEDVAVYTRTAIDAPWILTAVNVAKVTGLPFDDFRITFPVLPAATVDFIVVGLRNHEREYGITKGNNLDTDQLEKELSKQGVVIGELRRDLERAAKVPFGETGVTIYPGTDGQLAAFDVNRNISGRDLTTLPADMLAPTNFMKAGVQTWDDADEVLTALEGSTDGIEAFKAASPAIIRGGHILTPYDRALTNRVSPLDPLDADVSVAIQELFDLTEASWSVTRQAFDVTASGAYRSWYCASEVGIVGLKQPGVLLRDMTIFSKATGKIAVNFMDTSHLRLQNFHVYGDPDNIPDVGYLFGLGDTGSGFRASPAFKGMNWGSRGKFGKSNVVNFGSEVLDMGQHYHENASRSPTAAIYMGFASGQAFADYLPGLTSSLGTLPNGATGAKSNIVHNLGSVMHLAHRADYNLAITGIALTNPVVVSFNPALMAAAGVANGTPVFFHSASGTTQINGLVANLANVNLGAGTAELAGVDGTAWSAWTSGGVMNPKSGPAVILEGAGAVHADTGYVITQGNAPFVFDCSYGGALRHIDIGYQAETQSPQVADFKLGAAAATIQRLAINCLSAAQTYGDAVFTKSGAGTLFIHGHHADLASMPAVPPNGMWRDGAGGQSTIDIRAADYVLPTGMPDLDVPASAYAGFSGTIMTMNDGRRRTYTRQRTWTPSLKFGGASVGMVYAAGGQSGWIEDAGEFTFAHFRIALGGAAGNKGTSTGAATIEGLPEANVAGTGNGGDVVFSNYASLAGITHILGNVGVGTTVINLRNGGAASSTNMTEANFTDSSVIEGTAIYRTLA